MKWLCLLLLYNIKQSNYFFFFFSSRRRHTRSTRDWSSDVCSSDLVDPGLCFAEDIFGDQFTIKSGTVHRFAVETGALEPIAASLEKFAALVLADDRRWTGWPFAQRWADRHGPVPLHKRLHPATPFVCGGSTEVDNLRPIDAAEMMGYWGAFARRIRDVPNGAQIKLVLDPDPTE